MRVAAYARFSTEMQSSASIDDQLRNCRNYCARNGWPAPEVFSDEAMSGSRNDRPGYLRLLTAAREFDVVLVDDYSRLSRDAIEGQKTIKRLKFAGVRVIGVSDGFDTGRKGYKAETGLRSLMSELYIDDLSDKVHRGQTGKVLAGAFAGGLPYGYRVTKVGAREIDQDQAEVVRRIYQEYLNGKSPRSIATDLNRDGIPTARADSKGWAMSAIHGDHRRGIGILANPIYCGRMVWNRSRWEKHPETGRRVRKERPPAEWMHAEHPEMAIVDVATWEAVHRRLRGRYRATGTRGRPPRYLLSGVLRCCECGGPMVIVDRNGYGCSVAKDRGTCQNPLRVPRGEAEACLVAGLQEQLLTPEVLSEVSRLAAQRLKQQAGVIDTGKSALKRAEKERDNIMAAIRQGILTPTTREQLLAAEDAVERAKAALAHASQPATLIPQLKDRWKALVMSIASNRRQVGKAREALLELLGLEGVVVRNENGAPVAECAVPLSLNVVAGVGFGHYLPPKPLVIPLSGARIVSTERDACQAHRPNKAPGP